MHVVLHVHPVPTDCSHQTSPCNRTLDTRNSLAGEPREKYPGMMGYVVPLRNGGRELLYGGWPDPPFGAFTAAAAVVPRRWTMLGVDVFLRLPTARSTFSAAAVEDVSSRSPSSLAQRTTGRLRVAQIGLQQSRGDILSLSLTQASATGVVSASTPPPPVSPPPVPRPPHLLLLPPSPHLTPADPLLPCPPLPRPHYYTAR